MIATAASTWMLLVLLTCCGIAVVFGLLVRRRPVIGGLVVAAMVLMIMAFAFLVVPQGRHAAVWPQHLMPGPAAPIGDLERKIAKAKERGREALSRGVNDAREAYRAAIEVARVAGGDAFSLDETFAFAPHDDLVLPQFSVSVSDGVEFEVQVKEVVESPCPVTPASSAMNSAKRGGVIWGLLTAVEIAAFLMLGYVFLDSATRGQFTWPLRIASAVAFAGIYVAMSSLRNQL